MENYINIQPLIANQIAKFLKKKNYSSIRNTYTLERVDLQGAAGDVIRIILNNFAWEYGSKTDFSIF